MSKLRGPAANDRRIQFLRRDYSVSDTGLRAEALRPCCIVVDLEAVLVYALLCVVWGIVGYLLIIAWMQVP